MTHRGCPHFGAWSLLAMLGMESRPEWRKPVPQTVLLSGDWVLGPRWQGSGHTPDFALGSILEGSGQMVF